VTAEAQRAGEAPNEHGSFPGGRAESIIYNSISIGPFAGQISPTAKDVIDQCLGMTDTTDDIQVFYRLQTIHDDLNPTMLDDTVAGFAYFENAFPYLAPAKCGNHVFVSRRKKPFTFASEPGHVLTGKGRRGAISRSIQRDGQPRPHDGRDVLE